MNVTVKGPRSMVDKMTKDDFYAQAPFSEMSNVNAVPIYVLFRNSKYEREYYEYEIKCRGFDREKF